MTPLVSIVLPVRNGAMTLDRAMNSIVAQTFRDWELVVVDDGSHDETPAVLKAWAGREPRLQVVRQEPIGLVAALNRGLQESRGELIARIDADDEMHPERLQRQVEALQADAALGLVSCLVRFGGDAAKRAGYARHVEWLNSLVTLEEIALHRFVESPLAHPSVLFRRQLVSKYGGYRSGSFPEDYELWLRWLEAGVRMRKVPEALVTWHDSEARLSRTDSRYAPDAFYRLKAIYLARWLKAQRATLAPDAAAPGVWVWGAGRLTRQRAAWLAAEGIRVEGYIDIDPKKFGRMVGGVPVRPPSSLPAAGQVFVLVYVASLGARDLIQAELTRQGYEPGRDFLLCA
jgi:glycosyltransferase involved in cell wall biosynthesis